MKINKNSIKNSLIIIFLMFLTALFYNLLLRPINLVTGGTGGIAIILEEVLGLNPSVMIFVMYLILLIFSFLLLDKEDTYVGILITIVYPLFVELTLNISNIVKIDYNDILVIAIFSGVINGIINGIIYKLNLNTGGTSILAKIIFKYFDISVTKANFIINIIVVIFGVFIFGFEMVLYAGINLFLSKVVSDRIIMGISRNKVFHVVTDKYNEIRDILGKEFLIDCTIYNIKKSKNKFMMIAVSAKDYNIVRQVIHEIDDDAFAFISDGYEVKDANMMIRG